MLRGGICAGWYCPSGPSDGRIDGAAEGMPGRGAGCVLREGQFEETWWSCTLAEGAEAGGGGEEEEEAPVDARVELREASDEME